MRKIETSRQTLRDMPRKYRLVTNDSQVRMLLLNARKLEELYFFEQGCLSGEFTLVHALQQELEDQIRGAETVCEKILRKAEEELTACLRNFNKQLH